MWDAFWALDLRRTGNGYGANAISLVEIDAWMKLRRKRLRVTELEALDAMELARLDYLNKDCENNANVSQRPMTPELFDALF